LEVTWLVKDRQECFIDDYPVRDLAGILIFFVKNVFAQCARRRDHHNQRLAAVGSPALIAS
jgi:hypothetical protein